MFENVSGCLSLVEKNAVSLCTKKIIIIDRPKFVHNDPSHNDYQQSEFYPIGRTCFFSYSLFLYCERHQK